MGLGLTICHAVVQKHGGAIAVESAARRGTTFRIYLPASRNLPEARKAPMATPLPRPGRILVMDDEPAVRASVGASLQRIGHEVELAAEGQRAVEIYVNAKDQGRPFDAVILDLTNRGVMGGHETIQALLKVDPGVKAIVMTGYADDPVVRDPGRHGFRGALTKPFSLGRLREIVSRIMDSTPSNTAAS
jgi:DNA-binding NtrC family response regulator